MSDGNTEKAEPKKAKGKYAHLNDYKLTDDGTYEYAGVYHEWVDEADADAYARKAKLFMGIAIACLAVAGCVPAPGTFGAFYVVIPFLCAVIGVVLSATSIVRIVREGARLRDHIYEKSVPMLPAKLAIGGAGALSSAMGELAYLLVMTPEGNVAFAVVFVLVMIVAGAALLVLLNASMPLVRGEAWRRSR